MKNPFKKIKVIGNRTKIVALVWGVLKCLVAFGVIDMTGDQMGAITGVAGAAGAYFGMKHIDNK